MTFNCKCIGISCIIWLQSKWTLQIENNLQMMPGRLQRFCKGRTSVRKSWMHLFQNWRQNYCRRCWKRLRDAGHRWYNANAWQWRNFSAPGRPTTNQYYGSKLRIVWLVVVWPLCRMSTGSLVSQTKEKIVCIFCDKTGYFSDECRFQETVRDSTQ